MVPVVLVIIILVAWAVILGPSLVKRTARRGGAQSITHFHHQLRILEHSAPSPLVAPAYRLRAVDGVGTPTVCYPESGTPPKLTVVGAKALPRPALAFLGEPAPDGDDAIVAEAPRALRFDGRLDDPRPDPSARAAARRPEPEGWLPVEAPPVARDAAHRHDGPDRRQVRRRRRDTLAVLAAVLVFGLLVGTVSGATAVWALCGLDAVALVAYVALLVHLRRRAVERERKLHYLDGDDVARTARAGGLPTQVSGRYAHPSNQQAIAR